MHIRFEVWECPKGTVVFEIGAIGGFELKVYQKAADHLHKLISELDGKPFRTIIDLSEAKTLAPDQAKIFLEAQANALENGLEKDIFVTDNKVLRKQFSRLSKENNRLEKLGKMLFVKTIEEARDYICE